MSSLPSPQAAFASRHIGINETDIDKMLDAVGAPSMAALLDSVIPENIRRQSKMALAPALLEHEALAELKRLCRQKSGQNITYRHGLL
jgi:glycine dehydrogenase